MPVHTADKACTSISVGNVVFTFDFHVGCTCEGCRVNVCGVIQYWNTQCERFISTIPSIYLTGGTRHCSSHQSIRRMVPGCAAHMKESLFFFFFTATTATL